MDGDGKVEERNSYYPFGGLMADHPSLNTKQPYKYIGKKLDRMFGWDMYDHGARWYDAATGRWWSMDALSEKFTSTTPYSYGLDNPIKNLDQDGRIVETVWDVANLVADVSSFVSNIKQGNYKGAAIDLGAGALDLAAVTLPGVPGGAATAVKAARTTTKVEHQVKRVRTFQTYKKVNKKTGEVYYGRTSGYNAPYKNVKDRDNGHHMNSKGFGPAELDKSSKSYDAIRGREQVMIERSGGAKSQGGTSGNAINGVSLHNPKAGKYRKACEKEFGND